MRRKLRLALTAAGLGAAAVLISPHVVQALTSTIFTVGNLEGTHVHNDQIELKTKDATDVVVQGVTFEPGEFANWHTHPGIALISVKSGTITIYDHNCVPHPMGAGQSFVEFDGPMKAVNVADGVDDVPVTFFITYVIPDGSPRTIAADPPSCAL